MGRLCPEKRNSKKDKSRKLKRNIELTNGTKPVPRVLPRRAPLRHKRPIARPRGS